MKLYNFNKLSAKLDRLGLPQVDSKSGFRIIKGIGFEEAFKEDKIQFEDDGIFYEHNGKQYKGYMFIKEPWITKYDSYPKFHLTKCRTIEEFISNGKFKVRYEWSNSRVNDLVDKTTHNIYKDEVLEVCNYCKNKIQDHLENTADFFDSIDKQEIEETSVEVDIFGYTRNWPKISKDYRKRLNYKCEKCEIQISNVLDRRFLHTHHKNGDKTNNKLSNLECLCIRCHANEDERHKINFSKKRMKKDLDTFSLKYPLSKANFQFA